MWSTGLPRAQIKFKLLHPKAVIPCRKTPGSSGADVYSVEDIKIPPGEVRLVGLGFAVSMSEGVEIQIRPRSGLALQDNVTILNTPATIDSDYRSEVKVILVNFGKKDFHVATGDRIAQMVVNFIPRTKFIEVDELDITDRGEGGFGSTGRN